MAKVPISTRVEEEIAKRLDRIAAVDRRTVANIVEICVEEYLPRLEAELSGKKSTVLRDAPNTAPAQHTSELKYAIPGRSKIPQGKRAIAKDKEN